VVGVRAAYIPRTARASRDRAGPTRHGESQHCTHQWKASAASTAAQLQMTKPIRARAASVSWTSVTRHTAHPQPSRACSASVSPCQAQARTCAQCSSQQQRQQREEGVELLVLIAAARHANEEFSVPDSEACKPVALVGSFAIARSCRCTCSAAWSRRVWHSG